jgi:di/tricarboxylate transporter
VLDLLLMFLLAVGLVSGRFGAAPVFGLFILAVIVTGRIPFDEAFSRITSPAIISVASLIIASAALAKIPGLGRALFGRANSGPRKTLARFLGSAALASAITPNTAVVGALMGPAARNTGTSPHNLLLPLSYMSLAGGMLTPFGTSASLMVVGEARAHGFDLGVLDFFVPGIIVAISVFAMLVLVSPMVLSARQNTADKDAETFHVEAWVDAGSKLIGKSVSKNNLRHLKSFFLAEIIRDDQTIAPVSPNQKIIEGDRLIFVGDISHFEELRDISGLSVPTAPKLDQSDAYYHAIISSSSVLIGKTLQQVDFRARFDASVMAIRRGEEQLSGKLGDIRLRVGDALVLAAGPDFRNRENIRNNLHILDIEQPDPHPLNPRTSWMLIGTFAVFLITALFQLIPFSLAAFLFAAVLVTMQWISPRETRRIFPFDIIIILWGAILLSMMIQNTGLAEALATFITNSTQQASPIVALAAIFLLAWFMTELFSNASAALTTLPVAMATAVQLGLPPEAFILATAFGASASFLMPYGYQTHLMVMTPGQYRLSDFWRLGSIVFIAYAIAALSAIAWLHF